MLKCRHLGVGTGQSSGSLTGTKKRTLRGREVTGTAGYDIAAVGAQNCCRALRLSNRIKGAVNLPPPCREVTCPPCE